MTLAGAVGRIQELVAQLTNIRAAPAWPLENLDALPMAMSWPTGGEVGAGDDTYCKGIHRIRTEIYQSRVTLPQAVSTLAAYAESFPKILSGDPTLDGEVDTIVFPVSYTMQPIQFGSGTTVLALVFETTVKIMGVSSTSTT